MEDLNELQGMQKGQLSIAAPFTTLYHLLPQTLTRYIEQFPWVEVSLLDRSQRNMVELVKSGDVDLLKEKKLKFVSLNHYFPPEYMAVVLRKDKVLPSFKSAFLNMLSGG